MFLIKRLVYHYLYIIINALLYKGSTSDFGSDCRGSNPLGATTL